MSKEYEEMIEKVAKAFHYNSIDTKDIISHLETSTCRLAVMRKDPDWILPSNCECANCEDVLDMLEAGFVQEVKE